MQAASFSLPMSGSFLFSCGGFFSLFGAIIFSFSFFQRGYEITVCNPDAKPSTLRPDIISYVKLSFFGGQSDRYGEYIKTNEIQTQNELAVGRGAIMPEVHLLGFWPAYWVGVHGGLVRNVGHGSISHAALRGPNQISVLYLIGWPPPNQLLNL